VGRHLTEARSLLPAFLEATDREIAIARQQLSLSNDDITDRIPITNNLNDPDVVEMLLTGLDEEQLTEQEKAAAKAVITGVVTPDIITAEHLIHLATQLKSPAARTKEAWTKELSLFTSYCGVHNLLHCSKQNAVDYRSYLLGKVSANTAKTKLAYLTGLWSILEEVKGSEHIFRGITKRIKVIKQRKEYEPTPIGEWKDSTYTDIFRILYYTGCRLSEVCGLRYEDIKPDRITIISHPDRSLKTAASERDIPIHREIKSIISGLNGHTSVLIWPSLSNEGRWGVNLSKPCKSITGLNPHGLRHRAATRLREAGFNEAVIGKLLGHTPNTITGSYGSIPWSKLVEAVNCL
jgi:integrase